MASIDSAYCRFSMLIDGAGDLTSEDPPSMDFRGWQTAENQVVDRRSRKQGGRLESFLEQEVVHLSMSGEVERTDMSLSLEKSAPLFFGIAGMIREFNLEIRSKVDSSAKQKTEDLDVFPVKSHCQGSQLDVESVDRY